MQKIKLLFPLLFLLAASSAMANLTVAMYLTSDEGHRESVGTVTISQTRYGLLLTPHLHHLAPGLHGFHIHQNPSCSKGGMAAGGHFDPQHTNKHLGPYDKNGHLGDLPALFVNANGEATLPVLAPRISHIRQIKGHALMVHADGDNYADVPEKLGGGGARMACGVIK